MSVAAPLVAAFAYVRRRLAKAQASPDVADFVRRAFRGDDVRGRV